MGKTLKLIINIDTFIERYIRLCDPVDIWGTAHETYSIMW